MTEKLQDARPAVIIFRKVLLPWSETFIAAQGAALTRYRPVFTGYEHGAGAYYLQHQDRLVLADLAPGLMLGKALLKGFGIVWPRWLRELRARRPAVVHAHFGTNALDAARLARALHVPLVVTFHGSDIAKAARKASDRRKRQRIFAAASRAIAVSEFIAGQLRENDCPPEKIVLHHIGVDTERFAPGPDGARESRKVLFVGRMVRKKGGIHLVRAMANVQREIPDAELVLAGDGPLRKPLEDEARRLGVNATFLGVQTPDQVRELMQRAAVFCAPSVVTAGGDAEGLPMTVVEAQACGCPVVASPSGGTAEGIVEGVSGYIVPSGDEQLLADRLVRILSDGTLRARFSGAARAHMLANFDLRKQAAKLEAIYDDVRGVSAGG